MAKGTAFTFSDTALQSLTRAGWTPTRVVPSMPYIKAYEAEGLTLSSGTASFLMRFGGLLIQYAPKQGPDDVLGFLADEAVMHFGGGVLAQTEEHLQAGRLCPIGHYLYGLGLLLQADDEKVYGLLDDRTILVGDSGEAAIENILSGEEPHVIESVYAHDQLQASAKRPPRRRKQNRTME